MTVTDGNATIAVSLTASADIIVGDVQLAVMFLGNNSLLMNI